MGKYLNIIRSKTGSTQFSPSMSDSAASTSAKEAKKAKEGAGLESRLLDAGIRISIDRATGNAFLIFTESEARAVRDVATVHDPFAVELTPTQRSDLLRDLGYYQRLTKGQRE